ncbi:MAG: phosphoenolpyruvate carboxylase, partial [Anaerolineales bacterium]
MASEQPSLKERLAPLSDDIHLLGDMLGQVIREQEGQAAFQLEERVRKAAIARRRGEDAEQEIIEAIEDSSLEQKRILTKAFSNYFQLVNIAEDQQRVRVLRERERQGQLGESIDAALALLRQEGWQGSEILDLLDKLEIDLVLTAHPTEAKRQDFLFKLHELSRYIDDRDRHSLSPREQDRIRLGILAGIEEMWQTSVTRAQQPSVMDEVEFGLYFMATVVMKTVIKLHRELIRQLEIHFGERPRELPNFIHFSSWIGGDRDGHPFVTAEVTQETVARMRAAAREVYQQEVRRLRDRLTQTLDEVQPSKELLAALQGSADLAEEYPRQPYRQMMNLIYRKLEDQDYSEAEDLLGDLRLVESSLLEHEGIHASNDSLWDLIQMVRIFGMHLMPLDYR